MSARRSISPAVATALIILLAACSDVTGTNSQPLTVSISTRSSTNATLASAPLQSSAVANTLVITRAQVVLSEVELKSAASSGCVQSTREDDGCEEIKLDPVLVDLPVDGVKQLDLSTLVPPGTYRELEFKIDAVQSGDRGSAAFLAANPTFAGIALRIEGTFNGQPFVFTTGQDFHVEIELENPLVVGLAGNNLTIAIDLRSWFSNGAGDFLNPSSSSNRSLIENNIQRSIHAFEDDDRDGRRDD